MAGSKKSTRGGKDSSERSGNDANLAQMMAGPFSAMMQGDVGELIAMQSRAASAMMQAFLGTPADSGKAAQDADAPATERKEYWEEIGRKLSDRWQDLSEQQPELATASLADPARWLEIAGRRMGQIPGLDDETQTKFLDDTMALWESVFAQFGLGTDHLKDGEGKADLPRKDRRFKDPRWSEQPVFALIHQAYLLIAEQMMEAAEKLEGISDDRKEQAKFYTRLSAEAMSPAHFPLTNPLVLEKTIETGGENLIKGMEHMIADMQAGQLTHTDTGAFELGRDIAATPGKVIYQTDLFQLIQYEPTTETVLETPLVIFPPWINRFYILDLGAKKSFVRWAVEQGLTVYMVSWKSADASMADVGWEDYVKAQIEAIDVVRERLNVPGVHTIGYCVAGTTLAATLALLARRGEADKVVSATYFTAQVDFADAGELKSFIDEQHLATIDTLSSEGYVDGRYLAATFNLLRSPDLIWNYVIQNYLLGEDYRPFDLLYWNGDSTNLPARFHREYLSQLYHNNRLVVPDDIVLDGTPIDLKRIKTPSYIQAGREDHIAPLKSVWKLTRHFSGPIRFLLAGSGHIAGVVNPPESGKYQYWSIGEPAEPQPELPEVLDDFVAVAKETPGSWWPDWIEWIRSHGAKRVKATGKRKPGGRGNTAIEDAPGSYVRSP